MVEYTLYILLDGTMKHFGPFYFRVWAHFWLKLICFELDPWLDVLLRPATDLSVEGTVVDHL